MRDNSEEEVGTGFSNDFVCSPLPPTSMWHVGIEYHFQAIASSHTINIPLTEHLIFQSIAA